MRYETSSLGACTDTVQITVFFLTRLGGATFLTRYLPSLEHHVFITNLRIVSSKSQPAAAFSVWVPFGSTRPTSINKSPDTETPMMWFLSPNVLTSQTPAGDRFRSYLVMSSLPLLGSPAD